MTSAKTLADAAAQSVARVAVALGQRRYDIHIGQGVLPAAGRLIGQTLDARRLVVISDETVATHWLAPLTAGLEPAGHRLLCPPILVPPGEATKSFEGLEALLARLLDAGVDRKTILIALGGGVIGDLVGFAAAIALRGLDFVQVPTTLLSQVDSAVGGKTGINTRHGKNLVGAFHQPRLVLADMDTLSTLPRRERLAGYAEVVKYGLLGDAAFFAWLETHGAALCDGDTALLRQAVAVSCAAKAAVVAEDEREAGRRALLNLGHTFGHALEAAAGFDGRLLHGEAVAIGMVMAFDLSVRMGLCPAADAARVRAHLAAVGLPTVPPPGLGDTASLLRLMAQDKKAEGGRLTLVLTRGIGRAFVARDTDPAAVAAILDEALAA